MVADKDKGARLARSPLADTLNGYLGGRHPGREFRMPPGESTDIRPFGSLARPIDSQPAGAVCQSCRPKH